MIAVVPNRPSSSPMAAKMKSVSTTGMRSGLPRPRPVPPTPPHARANQLCTTWKPSPLTSVHGSSQIVDAFLHVVERLPGEQRAAGEQAAAEREVQRPAGGDPEQHDEQAEEQQRRAEVALGGHDDERRAPTPASDGAEAP